MNTQPKFCRHCGKAYLTERELQVLQCIGEGDDTPTIVDKLNLSDVTVKRYIYNLYNKIEIPPGKQARVWLAIYYREEAHLPTVPKEKL